MHKTCTLHMPFNKTDGIKSYHHPFLGTKHNDENDFCFEVVYVSQDSSVVIATRYGLDGPGI
jgi:hypothetical protein